MSNRLLRFVLILFVILADVACRRRHGGAGAPALRLRGDFATLADRALRLSRASEYVRSLTNEVGPRLSGSAGDPRAVAWAVTTMNGLGLANVHTEKVMVPRWVRGAESGQIVSPVSQPLMLTALGGSVATPEGGLEADVIEVDSIQALEALPRDRVEGRIVFYDKIMERTHDGSGYGRAVDVRSRGWIHASKKGAVGVVIRSVGTTTARFPHTGAMRSVDDVKRIPAAALAIPDAELLHRTIAAGKVVRIRVTLGCADLPDGDFDIHHTANDTFDKIDPKSLDQVTATAAILAFGAAELEGDLGRIPEERRK